MIAPVIRPGTLCLLVNGHRLEGYTCIVLRWHDETSSKLLETTMGTYVERFYEIAVNNAPRHDPESKGWGAEPFELFPLNDPDFQPSVEEVVDEVRDCSASHRKMVELWKQGMSAYIRDLERQKAALLRRQQKP